MVALSGHLLFSDLIDVYGLHMFHVFLNLFLINDTRGGWHPDSQDWPKDGWIFGKALSFPYKT